VRAGRIRITIMHPPGRPFLSESEAADMISHYFGESSGPRQVTLKLGWQWPQDRGGWQLALGGTCYTLGQVANQIAAPHYGQALLLHLPAGVCLLQATWAVWPLPPAGLWGQGQVGLQGVQGATLQPLPQ
jgi:hypothetical protein